MDEICRRDTDVRQALLWKIERTLCSEFYFLMTRKKPKVEQIVMKLRQVNVLTAQGRRA